MALNVIPDETPAAMPDGRFAVVAALYHRRYVDAMLREARRVFRRAGVRRVDVVRVPGAFEIPVVVGELARRAEPPEAIVCLGLILEGATAHARHIGDAVSRSLADLQASTGVPVIHEVLGVQDMDQARERCLPGDFNRGREAAVTALRMAQVMRDLR